MRFFFHVPIACYRMQDYAISEKIQAPESETPSFVPTSSQTETGILSVELAAGMSNDDENKSGKLHAALTGVVAVVCVTVVFLGVWGIMKLRKRRSAATGQSNTALDVSSSANQSVRALIKKTCMYTCIGKTNKKRTVFVPIFAVFS